ncbi:MAG: hypothetical protein NC253_03055 [Ruminococcus sp.]|nr:hypothetical protein [Ruminococcus sp.]MCM1380374.1 hypothetical protein [Muribaculaceae bacterium]MCM1478316.1 hypothetical protein [Muribaculaceae bacterium]
MKKRVKGISLSDLIVGFVILIILAVLIYSVVLFIKNAANKIDEGIVVNKNYQASYVSYAYTTVNDTRVMIPHTVPESYRLTIKGEKDGETVVYSFSVPELEYIQYEIGDHYPKSKTQS